MKKLVLFVVAIAATVSTFAQSPVGTFSITPKVGFNAANITGKDFDESYNSPLIDLNATASTTLGVVVGAEGAYQVTDRFAVSAGLIYSQQGAERGSSVEMEIGEKSKFEDNSKLALGYLNVPILANFYVYKGLAVKAGIQPGFLLSAKNENDLTYTGAFATSNSDNTKSVDVKDICNKFDFSIPVGVSYDFPCGIVLDLRYNIGLTKIGKDMEGYKPESKNSVFQLTIGYKLPLN